MAQRRLFDTGLWIFDPLCHTPALLLRRRNTPLVSHYAQRLQRRNAQKIGRPVSSTEGQRRPLQCASMKRAGVGPVTFHGLRHAHFTALLKAGVHPKIASERAGHSTVGVTLDLYSHVTEGMQQEAALRIDGALRSVLAR